MNYKEETAKNALEKFADIGDYTTVSYLIEQAHSLDELAKKLLILKHINRWSFDKIAKSICYSKVHTYRLYAKALTDYYDFYSELKITNYRKREFKDEIRR